MASLPEPPANLGDSLWYVIYLLGGGAAWFLTKHGLTKPPDKAPTATVSAALMDNRVVDPLVQKLDALIAATDRLCDLMEKEVGLRQATVDEVRKREEQKAIATAVADQVREDILEEMRKEMKLTKPASMPPTRTPRS